MNSCNCKPDNEKFSWYWHGNGRLGVNCRTGEAFIARSNSSPEEESDYYGDVLIGSFNYCPVCGGSFKEEEVDRLDWDSALEHTQEMRNIANNLPDRTGVFYAMECTRLLKRFIDGERTEELYQAMTELH